ncbi:MAG: AAA family ATPase [Candidatus Caldarchaeum sp.]|nr:AAA family ATPase [Candidatus Caldarchaeum sp.]
MSQELERIAASRAREAVNFDKLGQRHKAIKSYREAIDVLWKLYRLSPDGSVKKIYADKIKEYQNRIEELQSDSAPAVTISPEISPEPSPATKPSSLSREKPNVHWDDIVNIEEAKKAIRESIVFPTKRPDLFPLGWPRGILLFGPPGCGKTLLAAAVASELDASFYVLDAATVMSKWLGESERNISKVFNQCRQEARTGKPCIIFIDEIDSLTTERFMEVGGEARVRNQLIKEMDGILDKGRKDFLYVLAATNKPWHLDEPFIRRFQKRIFVPLPDLEARNLLFQKYTKGLRMDSNVELSQLAKITDGYSAADIHDICMEAQLKVVSEFFASNSGEKGEPRMLTMDDFMEIIKKRKHSVVLENLKKLLDWNAKHGT